MKDQVINDNLNVNEDDKCAGEASKRKRNPVSKYGNPIQFRILYM